MTKEQFASLLNGREYGEEITKEEEAQAKDSGLVVVFGYSDDNVEFRGAFSDEVGCGENSTVHLLKNGPLDYHEDTCDCPFCGYEKVASEARTINTVWNKGGYSWMYKTTIPHATFDIVEGEEKYCQGIVFDVSELG